MLAREAAYWREWLDTQVADADKNDGFEQAKLREMALLIESFTEFRF